MKPARSGAMMASLPRSSLKLRARSVVSGDVSGEGITSTSPILGTGLKKCMPRTRPPREPATAASSTIGMEEVLEARIACWSSTRSAKAWKTPSRSPCPRPRPRRSAGSQPQPDRRPCSAAQRGAGRIRRACRARLRVRPTTRCAPERGRPAASSTSTTTTSGRLAQTSAIPEPMVPPPATPALDRVLGLRAHRKAWMPGEHRADHQGWMSAVPS